MVLVGRFALPLSTFSTLLLCVGIYEQNGGTDWNRPVFPAILGGTFYIELRCIFPSVGHSIVAQNTRY